MNNDEILNKVDEIINLIESSDDYQEYLKLQEQINHNEEIILLINQVKLKQKDYAHHLCSKEELDSIINELNNHPLYREYLNKIDDINNTYSIIENTINNYMKKKFND